MKLAFVAVLAWVIPMAAQVSSPVDPAALIRQSIANYEQNWREAADWQYQETDITRDDDTTVTEVSVVAPLDGTPYGRLIEKDGEPLPEEEAHKEMRRFERVERERQTETPEERQARISKYDNERAFVKDVSSAYTFRLLGEDVLNGRPAWVIQLTPKWGFTPTQPHASMLEHIEGKLWIDKEDINWARAEAHVIDTIAIGWILARIGPGANITLLQTRVAPGFWMPKEIVVHGTARVLLVHSKPINEEMSYSAFRRVAGNPQYSKAAKPSGPQLSGPNPGTAKSFR